MSWRVEMRGENRVEESETMLRVQKIQSDWPRSARQLGQRKSDDNKPGDSTSTTQDYIKEGGLGQVGMSHRAKYRM